MCRKWSENDQPKPDCVSDNEVKTILLHLNFSPVSDPLAV